MQDLFLLASTGFSVVIILLSLGISLFAYLTTRLKDYLYISLTLLILAVGFLLLKISYLTNNVLIFHVSVFVVTPANVPLFLYLKRAFKKPVGEILEIIYTSLIALKFYDFLYTRFIDPTFVNTLSLDRARGFIGSVAFTSEMILMVFMITYVFLNSLSLSDREDIKSLSFLWNIALITFTSAITIIIMANYRLTGLYFILIGLFTFQATVLFYQKPLVSSLLHKRMYGIALVDLNGNILDYKLRNYKKKLKPVVKEEFFNAIKILLLRIRETSYNHPTLLEFNNKELLTFMEIPDKIITIYGWGLDKNTYNYLKLLLEKSDYDYNKFWSSLKDRIL